MSSKRLAVILAGLLGLSLLVQISDAQTPSYSNTSTVTSPAGWGAAITPSDSADLSVPCRGIWVGGAGNIVVNFINGTGDITLTGATAGSVIPIRVKRVKASSTTATNLVCLY